MRSLRRNGHPNHLLEVRVSYVDQKSLPVVCTFHTYGMCVGCNMPRIVMLVRRVMPSFFNRMSHIALFPRVCAVIDPDRVLIDIKSDVVDIITNVLDARTP